jgi:hypothetical protein
MAAYIAERAGYTAAAAASHAVALSSATAISVGNHLTARFQTANLANITSVTDPRGNIWQQDLQTANGTNNGAIILSCRVVTAYQAGDSITFNLSASREVICFIDEWNGFLASGWKGATSFDVQTVSLAAFNSGAIDTAGPCVQLGVMAVGNSQTPYTVNAESGAPTAWTRLGFMQSAVASRSTDGHYRIVAGSETGIAYDGTFSGARIHTSHIVEYKTVTATPPDAPSGLTATALSYKRIGLSWTDNSGGTGSFEIERAPDVAGAPGTYALIGTAAAGVVTYTDNWRSPSTAYWYRVRATNVAGTSGYSNAATATTTAYAPVHTTPPVRLGMWMGKAELDTRPTSGADYTELLNTANAAWPATIQIHEQNSNANIYCLAGALTFARLKAAAGTVDATADALRLKVADYIGKLIQEGYNTTTTALSWARNVGTFAICADLINLEGFDPELDGDFRTFASGILTELNIGDGMNDVRAGARLRPNNIGNWCRFSVAAISWYTGDTATLGNVTTWHKRWMGDTSISHAFNWGANQSWQDHTGGDAATWKGINSLNAVRDGHNFDGIQPDDQRRHDEDGATLGVYDPADFPTPATSNYPEESLAAALGCALILYRSGVLDMFTASDAALMRAVAQHKRFADNYAAKGYTYFYDSQEAPRPLVNYLFGLGYPETRLRTQLAGPSRGYGFTYWTFQGYSLPDDYQRSLVASVISTTAETLTGSTVPADLVAALRDLTTATGVKLPTGTHKFALDAFLVQTAAGHEIRYAYAVPTGRSLLVEVWEGALVVADWTHGPTALATAVHDASALNVAGGAYELWLTAT